MTVISYKSVFYPGDGVKISEAQEQASQTEEHEEVGHETIISHHPMGIKPLGNEFEAGCNIRRNMNLLATLPDELLLQILESLGPRSLLRLSASCKALYGFARFEDLWRSQYIRYVSIQ